MRASAGTPCTCRSPFAIRWCGARRSSEKFVTQSWQVSRGNSETDLIWSTNSTVFSLLLVFACLRPYLAFYPFPVPLPPETRGRNTTMQHHKCSLVELRNSSVVNWIKKISVSCFHHVLNYQFLEKHWNETLRDINLSLAANDGGYRFFRFYQFQFLLKTVFIYFINFFSRYLSLLLPTYTLSGRLIVGFRSDIVAERD